MSSFTSRIDRLKDRLEMERYLRTEIVLDDLSQSLYEFGDELAALDDIGVDDLAAELEISPTAVLEMAKIYARPVWR